MAAPVAILAKPDDHRGILAMGEADDAMIDGFRHWALPRSSARDAR